MSDQATNAATRGSALSDWLGPAPWDDDVEAWLEVRNAEEIADDIRRWAMAEAARLVSAERERCAKIADEHARRNYPWGSENTDR